MPDIEPKKKDVVEPEYVFGFLVRGVANGQGVKFDPIDPDNDPEYARKATVDDILNSCKGISLHIETGIIAGKVMAGIQQVQAQAEQAAMRKIKGKLH